MALLSIIWAAGSWLLTAALACLTLCCPTRTLTGRLVQIPLGFVTLAGVVLSLILTAGVDPWTQVAMLVVLVGGCLLWLIKAAAPRWSVGCPRSSFPRRE